MKSQDPSESFFMMSVKQGGKNKEQTSCVLHGRN